MLLDDNQVKSFVKRMDWIDKQTENVDKTDEGFSLSLTLPSQLRSKSSHSFKEATNSDDMEEGEVREQQNAPVSQSEAASDSKTIQTDKDTQQPQNNLSHSQSSLIYVEDVLDSRVNEVQSLLTTCSKYFQKGEVEWKVKWRTIDTDSTVGSVTVWELKSSLLSSLSPLVCPQCSLCNLFEREDQKLTQCMSCRRSFHRE